MNKGNTKRFDVRSLFVRAIGTLKAIDLILDILIKLEESDTLSLILDLWVTTVDSDITNMLIGLLG